MIISSCMKYAKYLINLFSLFSDASSSNEAVHLQQRLKSLSTELLVMRNRLHVEGQVQGRSSDAQPHHSINVGVGVGSGVAQSGGGVSAKASNFDLNASSPNLNMGAAAAPHSANALQQHVNAGAGQHTLPKVSSSQISGAWIPI